MSAARWEGCTLALVAGGAGRRLGGVSKAHLRLPDGRTLLDRTLALVRPRVEAVIVVAPNPARFPGFQVITDRWPGRGAPGAIATACLAARTPWVLALAADLPHLSLDVLDELWRAREEHAAVCARLEGGPEPLHAFYRAESCAEPFRRALDAGEPSCRALLELVDTRFVPAAALPDLASFDNVNVPADLARWGLQLPEPAPPGVGERPMVRLSSAGAAHTHDSVSVEEPLEIRVDGDTVAVTMRTPGDDAALALGFLLSEGLIRSADDVGSLVRCARPDAPEAGNVLDVRSAPGRVIDPDRVLQGRRWSVVSAACGVCGRTSIDDLVQRCGQVTRDVRLSPELVQRCVAQLREKQPTFQRTGGLHAALVFDAAGEVIAAHEDVGRHNAVDKALGSLLRARRLGEAALLAVSGRTSFEIVQKAAAAGVPVVASVSAASTLAIDLAAACGVTLAAFVRGESMNVYTHPARLNIVQ